MTYGKRSTLRPLRPNRRRDPGVRRGFTLIELLLALVVIGILASLAVTTYKRMADKARMTQAKMALHHLFKTETTYFSEHDVYTDCTVLIDFDPVKYPYYEITIVLDNTAKNFTGIATGVGPMAGDRWFVTKEGVPYQDNASRFR